MLMQCKLLHGDHSPIDDDNVHRENFFHTRCMVNGGSCFMIDIVDSGSCSNAASKTVVDALGLHTRAHPNPL